MLRESIGTYLRDSPIPSDVGLLSGHPSRAPHWVAYVNQNFISFGFSPAEQLSMYIGKLFGFCFCFDHNIQGLIYKKDSYFPAYCLYIKNLLDRNLWIGF